MSVDLSWWKRGLDTVEISLEDGTLVTVTNKGRSKTLTVSVINGHGADVTKATWADSEEPPEGILWPGSPAPHDDSLNIEQGEPLK